MAACSVPTQCVRGLGLANRPTRETDEPRYQRTLQYEHAVQEIGGNLLQLDEVVLLAEELMKGTVP